MKIPRYWALGIAQPPDSRRQSRPVACWRWSDASVEDAQRSADTRALELSRLFAAGGPLNHYFYGEQPLREEVIRTLQPGVAVITRNLYGALVLNTSRAMFIDVDFAAGGASPMSGIFGRLLGKPAVGPEERGVQKIRDWASRRHGLGMRVYRTFAGLRCLVTDRTFDPVSEESLGLQRDIGSDPLYVRLCQAQASFRARLTPKPWRCGAVTPPERFPWRTETAQARFRQWQADYDRSIQGYTVCRFIEQIGTTTVHPEVQPILALHDQFACARPDRPLA